MGRALKEEKKAHESAFAKDKREQSEHAAMAKKYPAATKPKESKPQTIPRVELALKKAGA